MILSEKKLREKICADLTEVNYDKLAIIATFIDSLKKTNENQQEELNPINQETKTDTEMEFSPASGKGYLRHAGKWVGNDLEDCLKKVYEVRGKVKVNNRVNPFE